MRKIVLILGVLVAFWVASLARWPPTVTFSLGGLGPELFAKHCHKHCGYPPDSGWLGNRYLLNAASCSPAVGPTQSTTVKPTLGMSGVLEH